MTVRADTFSATTLDLKHNVLNKRFQIEKNLMELNLTRKCMISIKKSFDGVMNLEDWAVQSEYETN